MNNNNSKRPLVLLSVGPRSTPNRKTDQTTIHPIKRKVLTKKAQASSPAISKEAIRSLSVVFCVVLHALYD